MKIKLPPRVLTLILVVLYRLLCRTLRLEPHNIEPVLRAWDQGRQVVFACWHNELFCLPWLNTARWYKNYARWVAIVSASKDGEVLAAILNRLGIAASRGSSSREGVRALMGAVRIMKREGRQGVVTVDGPRGPRHEVKDGVLLLAQKTGALLVPVRSFPEHKWIFAKAWDKFELPKPFSRCRLVIGEPYALPKGRMTQQDLDRERRILEQKLHALG